MNNLNCKDLVVEIRSLLDEGGITSGKWSDTEIVRAINRSKDLCVNLINRINPDIMGKTPATITYVSGTELYDLPRDFQSVKRLEVASTKEKYDPIDMDEKEVYRATNEIQDSRPAYYLWGNQIGLVNASGNATLYYLRKAPNIHYGTVSALAGTTFTFDLTPNGSTSGDYTVKTIDDYYNGTYVDVYSGTGEGQEREITDYTGSTKICTVATWSTNPDTSSLYALKWNLPVEVDEWVILSAAMRLYPKDKTKRVQELREQFRLVNDSITRGSRRSKERRTIEYRG